MKLQRVIFSPSSCLPVVCLAELHKAADETDLVGLLVNSFNKTRLAIKTQLKAALIQGADSHPGQTVKSP